MTSELLCDRCGCPGSERCPVVYKRVYVGGRGYVTVIECDDLDICDDMIARIARRSLVTA